MQNIFFKRTIGLYSVGLLCLIAGLSGCAPQDKSAAILEWKAGGRADKIIKQLYDPMQSIREEAIIALAEMKAEEAIAPLGALFTDPDLIIVHAAVDAVAAIGGPEIEPYMLKAVTLDTVPARITGAAALGAFKSEEAVDALIVALDDHRYEAIVLAAIKALGQTGDSKAIEPLYKKLQERSDPIRKSCITSLQQIGGEPAFRAIASRLGDFNKEVRGQVIDALISGGKDAAPSVLEALRHEKYTVRADALTVLAGIEAVPESGKDLVWFRLAELTAAENVVVKAENAAVFSAIDNPVPGLLEGLRHPSAEVRAYASIALEDAGEEAAEAALVLVDGAGKDAGDWFNSRSDWIGAPSWRLDLWAAAAAMNPKFFCNNAYVERLAKGGAAAEAVMKAEQFTPRREIIPYLLLEFRKSDSSGPDVEKQEERNAALAAEHLLKADYDAVFPLAAALNGSDVDIAVQSARVLNEMGGERIKRIVTDVYFLQFAYGNQTAAQETQETEGDAEAAEAQPSVKPIKKTNPLYALSGSPLHLAIYEFDIPELEPIRSRIRPSAEIAIRDFKQIHPGITVTSLPLLNDRKPSYDEVPVRLSYYKNRQMNDLNVVYRRNQDKTWSLSTAIPSELP